MFLRRRKYVLKNTDSVWAESAPRVDLYQWLLEAGAAQLDKPLQLYWANCSAVNATTGHMRHGPCVNKTADAVSVGGVVYGDFRIP